MESVPPDGWMGRRGFAGRSMYKEGERELEFLSSLHVAGICSMLRAITIQ